MGRKLELYLIRVKGTLCTVFTSIIQKEKRKKRQIYNIINKFFSSNIQLYI
jgi:hypothetical protein